MIKLGIVVFANDGGLGNQTKRLVQMLKPFRILLIDSRGFSKNKQLNTHWYDGFQGYKVSGFPTNHEVKVFLRDLTHVLVCENPLNPSLFSEARKLGIKTYCQSNYEFCDNLNNPDWPLPDLFLMPSYWHVQTMADKFGADRVQYLPPPINPNEFANARTINFARTSSRLRLLHIVGTLAAHDRNGTLDLLEALKHTEADFDLVIRSQHQLPDEYLVDDSRVTYVMQNATDPQEMYTDFDAVFLPRRYGGLSLGTNEALMSGLPVFMPDIPPNNQLLPSAWVFPAMKTGSFFTRTNIDIHGSAPIGIAQMIDGLSTLIPSTLQALKAQAFELGYNNFSDSKLLPEYEKLWSQ